ncbi:MAG: precorrin-3B C(17)-methyltransferase, partial [Oscillibacter sp.]|nr:precorrin-3B C(17)-methyltransferase [Oscillibacter sp.]
MGQLSIVGIGPGDSGSLTAAARSALDAAEEIWGYTLYIDLLVPLFPGKVLHATPMGGELDRCRRALAAAEQGAAVALICGGDAGV